MSENPPILKAVSLGFFSEWFVEVIWPDGQKQKVGAFKDEAHARGWIEHESAGWIARARRPNFWT